MSHSAMPVAKVGVAGLAGAGATLVMVLFAAFAPELYGRLPAGTEGAICTFFAFLGGYMKRG